MNWSFVGAASYLLLFQGSTWLTELLTAGKYPEYKEYQRQTGMFLPSVWRGAYKPLDEPAKVQNGNKHISQKN